MTAQALTHQEASSRKGCENLCQLLDPAVVQAPRDPNAWQKLDHLSVVYFTRTLSQFPWFNHLALAGIIYAEDGIAHPINAIRNVHSFLRWAIPKQCPSLSALVPEQALLGYFGNPPRMRGQLACTAYTSLQLHLHAYLQTLSADRRAALTPFLLSPMNMTLQIRKLNMQVTTQSRAHRKQQAFAVAQELPALMALGRRRYHWLADLEAQVRSVADLVRQGRLTLPAVIQCPDLEHRQTATFRVWDRLSWIRDHAEVYSLQTRRNPSKMDGVLFLQLVGDLPESPWFLRAIQKGLLERTPPPEARQYLHEWQLPGLMMKQPTGLLRTNISLGRVLSWARRVAAGTPEDSRVVFGVEPLLAGAAVGLFTLVCLAQTGMRIGELMQVTLDRECMETGYLPQFDDPSQQWIKGPRQFYWRLFPKGRSERERYPVTAHMLEALYVLIELQKRYGGQGALKPVSAQSVQHFSHTRRFVGEYKFVLQWKGKQLTIRSIENCLDFLLLEHPCRDPGGHPTRITSHVLRHGVASWLRQQGIPLDEIMALLKHVNISVTDYYSQLSPQDLFQKIGPALTALADLAEIEPQAIRSVGDLEKLVQTALKRYGVLRHTPGGTCASFLPCEVQFKCANCPNYIPDPARRCEIEEKIATHAQAVRVLETLGDYLQADVQRAHGRTWERVAKEMDALVAVEIISPPTQELLQDFGIDPSGEELLLNLQTPLPLPSGDPSSHD
ncbi:MAG: site-specific integrase [Chloroflexi bacterium]|nr:site-specific integrase [Chloroflexota bacterium]